VAYFKVLLQHLPGRNKKNHERFQNIQLPGYNSEPVLSECNAL